MMLNGATTMRDHKGRFVNGSGHLVTHGQSKTKIYNVWRAMRSRCENPNTAAFKRYGARGISVCERWKSFQNFIDDMGECPPNMTLERVDNDGPYSPENCVWASRAQQSRNNSRNRILEIDGVKKSMTEWSEESGIKAGTIWLRLNKGINPRDAVFNPTRNQMEK